MVRLRSISNLILLALLTCYSVPSRAWTFTPGVYTDIPVSAGIGVQVHHASGVLGEVRYGWVPDFYVDMANGIASGLGLYSEQTAGLLTDILPGSGALEISVGYGGLWLENLSATLGYVYMSNSSGSTGRTVLEAVLDRSLSITGSGKNVGVQGSLNALILRLAYQIDLPAPWMLNGTFAVFKPLSGSATVDLTGNFPTLENQLSAELTDYLNDVYSSLWIPALGVSIGYSF